MKIVLAVDGSEQSYDAVRAVAHLSRADEIIIVHVLDVPRPAYPTITPEVASEIYASVERELRKGGELVLSRSAAMLPLDGGPVTRRLEMGKPADTILALAQEMQADLVVMGTRGVGPFKAMVLGSVSHRVLSHVHCPALVVKHPLRRVRRVLLAVQGQEDAEAAAAFASKRPFREPVEVTVVTAVSFAPPPWPADAAVAEDMKANVLESARYFAEEVASRFPGEWYRARPVARLGTPATVILKEAASRESDLILMGSRGRRGVTRFVLGSVSQAVLHEAACPMLLFPWPGA